MQLVLILVAAVIVLAMLALPRLARANVQPVVSAPILRPIQVQPPAKYGTFTLQFFEAPSSEVGFPALDASSKDAAKMTIKWKYESQYEWIKSCQGYRVTANTPKGLVAQTNAIVENNACVASMKLPADVPLNIEVQFANSPGWIQSVEGGHATADVVTEKVGPDHIVHKHIAGVKYEDITLTAGQVRKDKWIVAAAVPQVVSPIAPIGAPPPH